MLCPWADVLYAMDRKWWTVMRSEVQSFRGHKYSSVGNIPGVKMTPAEPKGGNSGAGAIHLAAHMGAENIVLLGYDCDTGKDGIRHWHGSHKAGLGDAVSLPKFAGQFEHSAKHLRRINIVNASRHTLLEVWPRITLEAALDAV